MRSIKIPNEELFNSVLELIDSGRDVKITVSGKSMEPFIKNGESVVIGSVSLESIKLGNIVLGLFNNSYVFHRVVRKSNDYIFLAGDNNLKQIERVEKICVYAVGKELITKDKRVDLQSFNFRIQGLIWFFLRPFRRLYVKLINNKLGYYEIKK